MDNDKVYVAYALFLFAGVASMITASVAAGVASFPTPVGFAEHLAMSFGFRAAYKAIPGFSWDDWTVAGFGEHAAATVTAMPGQVADAAITKEAA